MHKLMWQNGLWEGIYRWYYKKQESCDRTVFYTKVFFKLSDSNEVVWDVLNWESKVNLNDTKEGYDNGDYNHNYEETEQSEGGLQ